MMIKFTAGGKEFSIPDDGDLTDEERKAIEEGNINVSDKAKKQLDDIEKGKKTSFEITGDME